MDVEATSLSLLQRLRGPDDSAAWQRFVSLYTPMLLSWGRRLGLGADDAADLAQDVLLLLVRKLPSFVHDGQHSFRAWLKTVLRNCWLNRQPRPLHASLEVGPEPAVEGELDRFIEQDYFRSLARRALQLMQSDFESTTWRACWETVVEQRPAAEVGAELGISPGAVYVARSRVLARLRQELAELVR